MAIKIEDYYRQFGPMVLRRCRKLLRDEEQAVDAMQDVFVELLRRQDSLEISNPSSFLYRTATNICLNRIRSQRRKPAEPDTDLLTRIAVAPSHGASTMARLRLDRIFAREQPSTRTIAVLHLLDGMTLQEVADEVGLSVSGVRKRLRTLRSHVYELEGAL